MSYLAVNRVGRELNGQCTGHFPSGRPSEPQGSVAVIIPAHAISLETHPDAIASVADEVEADVFRIVEIVTGVRFPSAARFAYCLHLFRLTEISSRLCCPTCLSVWNGTEERKSNTTT